MKSSRKLYAMKYMRIEDIVKGDAIENILREIYILKELFYFPLLVNLAFCFHDARHLYLGLDLMLGGDLSFHMSHGRRASEDMIRFWMAELAVALHYLHKRGIIHRDIKPQNLLLDADGGS